MDLVFIILYIVYFILNVFDGITTWIILKPDHFNRELNPAAKWIFIKLGIPRGIIITEAAVLAVLTPLIFWLAAVNLNLIKILLLIAVLIFTWVVADGFRIIHRMKRKGKQ
ncbi:MAG: DUF5658 family protein [Candidatus Cloacimonadaceae bacterium]